MKRRMLSIILMLILTVAVITCVAISASAADTTSSPTLPTAEKGEVIDVWLVAGQSNAIGSAKPSNYPTDEAYADYKTLLTNGSQNVWHLRNTYTDFVPAGFSQGSGTQSGPEIGIATALDKSENKNAIIKVAYGNTCLYENTSSNESIKYGTWTPPSYIEKHNISTVGNRTGDLYLTFIAKVAEGLEKLVAAGYTPNLKGVWYMQGEADTLVSSTTTARYEELLLTLISDMRADLTEVSGLDCSELPFVYGRILSNHAAVGKTVPTSLTKVQAAQDNVANNADLKNVFMINTSTDLVDPVTGEHRLPVQQDSWHYDSLSQQMIGEKFVSLSNTETRLLTKYGYLPEGAGTNPFAILKKIDGGYVFDSYQASTETAIAKATALTAISGGTTEEAVILMLKNYGAGNYGKEVAKSGGTITLDLNGHEIAPSVTLFTTVFSDSTADKKTVFNIKNGKMLFQEFGVMFTTGSTSKSQSFELNVDNVEFGFIAGTETKAQESYKYRDILVSDRNCTTSGGAKVTIDINVTNSTFDLVTNAQSNATIGTLKENSANDNCYTDYNLLFEGCTFKASKPDQVACVKSSSGDTVKFIKNENDGSYGHLLLPSGAYEDVFVGIDGEYEVEVKPVHKNGVYYLVEISDAETAYGTIPAAYSNSYAYPYAIFMKVDGAYVFDSVQSNVNTSFTRATELTHVKTGVTDDVVILARRSIGADGTYPLNNSDIAGTVTLDLNGYTIRPTTALLRTDWDDDGVVDGVQKKATVNIKNGAMELSQFGILFTTVTASYTVPKTFDINLDNVKLSFYETTGSKTAENYKWRDLLASDRSNSATTKSYINIKATDCTFDLATNAQANAVLGTLECGTNDKDMNDYTVEIIGGTIITDDFAKVSCVTKGTGDSLAFKKGADGKYPKILINQALAEPSGTEYRNGEDGKTVSVMETSARVDIYKVYEFCEDVMTKYGRIPLAASVNDFAVFARNGEEAYTYYGAYGGWKLAFEAARNATNGSSTAYDEAVVFMLRDSVETSVPYHQDACGIINVDLNGKKLIVKGSFFNTYLVKSNSPTSTINVFDGTLLTYKYGLIYTAIKSDDTTYETAGVEKTITLNFSNVDLGFDEYTGGSHKSLTAYAYSGSAALNMTVNMNFDNCTFDLVTNAQTTTLLGNGKSVASATANANTVDFNLDFTDCEFLVYSPAQIAMSMSEEGDSFVINKGSDGKYATVFTNSSKEEVYADIIPGFDGTNSVKLRTSYLGLENGNAKYELIETDGNITITTSYGVIPTNYTNLASYPFAVFYKDAAGKYQFKAGYATYKEAMTAAIALTTAAIASPSSEAVVLLRTDWSGGTFPSNLSNIATTVTVDLDGHTLGALESLGNTTTGDVKDPNGNIVKTNGTINYKNGRILLKVHPGLYIAKGTTYTAGYQKTLNVNYDNVYIGMAEGAKTIALLGRIASNLTTETAIFNIKYTGCTIDMATNYSTGANFIIGNWAPASGTDATKVTVDFIDCDFLGLTEADFQHRITAGQDVVRYTSTSGDNYATLTLPKGASAPEGTYLIGSIKAEFVKLSETETTVTYVLAKAPEAPPVVTDYGTIPSDYVNATSYPFAVFSKLNGGEYSFSGAYSKWSTAMKAAQSLIAAANGATVNDCVAILLRKNFNIGADLYSDTSYMGGHLILDLDGHTMTLGTSLMSIRAFDYDTGKTCTTYVTVKNGSLVNNTKYGIIYSRIEETCTVEKTYYLDFDNVNFSFGASATSKTLLIHSFEQNNRSGSCKINVAYDNCFFDFDTNVPEGAYFLNLKSVSSVTTENDLDFTVVFNGCTFEGAGAFDIPLGEGDSVTFGDGTILKVANGTAAPTGTYVTNNGNAKLVKTAAVDGDYTIYTLLKESIASYAPKTSLTLDTNLIMNVYLPVEGTLKFTFDGVNYENLADLSENVVTLENGEKYYHVVIALPAAEAAKDMKLAVTVGDDTYSVVANFTFSTLKYAGKLIAGGSEIEKQLAKDVVAYIQAAYNYFVTLNTAEEIARVDTLASELLAIGGDYNGEPTSSGATVTASPVTSVTLNLGDNPTIRFYVTDTSVEFYIGTRKLQTVKGTDATHGAYVEIDEYAYMLCETITYGDGGSYHISSFLEGAAGEDHENLVACFIKYTESAAEYRKSVIN